MEKDYEITNVGFINEDYEKINENEFLLQGTVYGKQKDDDCSYYETCDDFDFTYNIKTKEIVLTTLDKIFTNEERTKIIEILLDNLETNFRG